MKLFLIVGLLLQFSFYISKAQSRLTVQNQYRFKYITVDQGLSNNNIRSVCQDSKGFIWIATQNGTNKFDGQTIVTYWNEQNDSSTISSNDVNTIFQDSKNNLWIGSSTGLDRYNWDFDNFIRFSHKDIDWPIINVDALVEDKDGKLWIGAETGLYSYNLNTYEIQYFSNKPGNSHGIPPNSIIRLLVDKKNNVWISILNEGLCVYNQTDGNFSFFKNDSEDSTTISGNRIEILYEDSEGNIWAGTYNDGLNLFITETNSFIRMIPDHKNNYSLRVRAIFEDQKGNFFVGTRSGLYFRNDFSNKFYLYADEGHSFSNISQNSVTCSYIDRTGTLWIGTFSGGVNFSNLKRKEFTHYKAGKGDNHYLSGAVIYAINEDLSGNLWVGADNGLNYLDRNTGTFKYYFNDPKDPHSLSSNDIKVLDWDKKGNLWIGTNNGGLNYYNVKTGQFKSYKHNPGNLNSLSGDKVYGLLCDKNNDLWIITNTNIDNQLSSIDILPNGSDKFIHLNEKAYFGFDQNENGDVFIGGVNGFWIFSGKDSVFSFIANDSLISNVNTIRKDSKDRLWIGSRKGLVRYNQEDKSFVGFSEDNGYPISEVFGILEDDAKSLWVSTSLGLVKITNVVEDINKIDFRVFDGEDGVQSKQFNYNAFYKSKTGELIFGGINGFNTFYPNEIVKDTIPPNIVLTNLKVYNRTIPIGKKIDSLVILKRSIMVADEITLGPEHNVFTLEFAALHYANPEKNSFKYKLEGFDKEWQYRKASNNFVTYTNLPAGVYTFIVTTANNDGVWNKEPVKLKITILPPWWKTIWFKVLVILFVFLFILAIFQLRLRTIKRQKLDLKKQVDIRTEELKQKNLELVDRQIQLEKQSVELNVKNDQLDELNKSKDKLFSIIAHDLKNPIGNILGFTSLLIDDNYNFKANERNEITKNIHESTQKIFSLLENLLLWSRNQLNHITITPSLYNITNQIYQVIYFFEEYVTVKNIKLIFEEKKEIIIFADMQMIDVVLRNLITNAIKFSAENETVKIELLEDDDIAICSIADNGIGMTKEQISNLFKIDKVTSTEGTQGEKGTGLGLSLCLDFLEKNNGKIWVKSTPNNGSTFYFSLPTKNSG